MDLDDGFTDLEHDADGRAHFSIEGQGRAIEISFGPKYRAATIYVPSPPPEGNAKFICIEPLAAIISGINLAHRGRYTDLQHVPPGDVWSENFWVEAASAQSCSAQSGAAAKSWKLQFRRCTRTARSRSAAEAHLNRCLRPRQLVQHFRAKQSDGRDLLDAVDDLVGWRSTWPMSRDMEFRREFLWEWSAASGGPC